MRTFAVLLVLVATVSGCATLSKDECLAEDWYSIGVRDGANGAGDERVLEHAKACAEHGTRPDRVAWAAGRADGLVRYCTVRRGLEAGENGEGYRGVCGPGSEAAFLHGYALGRELAEARADLSRLETEIRELERRLDADDRAAEGERLDRDARRALRSRLVQYEVERFRRQAELRDAEARAASL